MYLVPLLNEVKLMMIGFLKPFMQLMGLGTEATNLPTNAMPAIPVSQNSGPTVGPHPVLQGVVGQAVCFRGHNFLPGLSGTGNNSACMICYHCSLIISTHSFILGGSTQRTHHKIIGLHCQFKH